MFVHEGDDRSMETRVQEEFAHKQAFHHSFYMTEASSKGQRTGREGFDETSLKTEINNINGLVQ